MSNRKITRGIIFEINGLWLLHDKLLYFFDIIHHVIHENEYIRFHGSDKCPLQPPKATKNKIFRELLVKFQQNYDKLYPYDTIIKLSHEHPPHYRAAAYC